jgi:hypothetical protein
MLLRHALAQTRTRTQTQTRAPRESRSEWDAALDLQRAARAPLESDTGETRTHRAFSFTIDWDLQ